MSFATIKGQDKALNILKGYFQQERLAGGYLFSGPEGVGKKLAAITLAKALNCQEGDFQPCDKCASCIKVDAGNHPDLHIIDSQGGEIKIEYIRQLQREIFLRPYEGRKKLFIIDDCHRLNAEAQNALLKVLEEPPKSSLIILITDKPSLLFKTIISRCKQVKFQACVREKLQEILNNEYGMDKGSSHFLSYFSEGRIGFALRLKQERFQDEKNRVIDAFTQQGRQGLNNIPLQDKQDARKALNILASWFRDIYLIKSGVAHSEIINFDRRDDLLKLMNRFSFVELNEIMNSISDSIMYIDQNINLRLMLHSLESQIWKD